MTVRAATKKDVPDLDRLLRQVLEVHHKGRPDLFRGGTKKYTENELFDILANEKTPVFVAVDESDAVLGYAFCVLQQQKNSHILTDIKTLYIDDLCVDERCRGQRVGKTLYDHCVDFARKAGCYNLTLNVWSCNEGALRFYEKCGLLPQKIGMEKIL